LAFSPDGEQLAITSSNVGVVIHSARDGKKLAEWDGPLGDTCQFSPDGRQLLESGNTRPVNLHDATTGRLLWAATRIGPAVFDPSGQFILVASDEKVRLLNPKDGSELRELADVRSFASSLAIRPDGNRALIGQRNGFVRCVDLKDGRVLFETRAGTSAVHSVAYTPDGTRFVTWTFLSDKRLSLQVWDAESGAFLRSLLGGGINSTYGGRVRIHPISGELVASGRPWKVWDIGECPREKWLFTPTVARSIGFWRMDDWVFVCSGENGRICKMSLVDLQRKEPRDQPLWKPGPHSYRTISVSADGRFAVVGGGVPTRVICFLRLNGQKVEAVQTTQFERKNIPGLDIEGVALSPLGDRLWLNGVVLDPSTGAELLRRDRRGIASSSAACWLNNTQVVTADVAKKARGQDGSEEQLVLWDATTGQRLRTVVNPSPIFTLAVAPDGKTVAEAGADKMVRLRDAATLEVLDEFRAHDDAITALAFHPNRPILATGSADLTIKLWDLDTGRKLDEFRGHTSAMESIAFSPSGRRLGSVSAYDRTTRIWEPESLNPDAATKIKADGWEDLLTKLKRNELAKNRNGWQLNNGVLASPNKKLATIALPGQFAQCSYQVRVKLRQLTPKSAIHVFLPVADRLTSFMLDGYPSEGHWSCLHQINGTKGKDQPGTVKGKVVKESELHELELTVRLEGSNVRFETRLDNQPLYQWAGSSNALGLEKAWQTTPPGALALGAHSADWLVYAVKVKRLEGKP
jgi:WD40 repeat protein